MKQKNNCRNRNAQDVSLEEFKNLHRNDTLIVCGCGNSLTAFSPPENVITIGVNDVGRQFTPDYLVVLNPKNQFKGDRYAYVENSRAKALFTQLKSTLSHPNIVPIKLGKRNGIDCFDSAGFPFTRNSPYVALCLAMYMGVKRIGLIGVDFTDHHFFSRSGKHPLSGSLEQINIEYRTLMHAAKVRGVEIVNLSLTSRIDAFPKIEIQDFELAHSQQTPTKVCKANSRDLYQEKQLNIVSYSTSPVAGVPELLSRCINHYTPHQSRCVWATNNYGNGVVFNSDVEWKQKPGEAIALIKKADVIIVHNGKVTPAHKALFKKKAVITMAHNYLWNVDTRFVKAGYPGVVVGQYQAALAEFTTWQVVQNPMPLWEKEYQHNTSKNEHITICYTPSGKHEIYPKHHRLYWHSKGYVSTMAILARLAKQYPIKLEVIGEKQCSLAQVLAMKQRSHIVIDECVTGSYHRNSLEGLACGCVVINGMGLWPKVEEVFNNCTESNAPSPFVGCTLDNLESVLRNMIKQGRDALLEQGENNRSWMAAYWNFEQQWQNSWQAVVASAMEKVTSSRPLKSCTSKPSLKSASARVAKEMQPLITSKDAVSRRGSNDYSHLLHGSKLSIYWTCRGSLRGSKRGNFGDMLSPLIGRALSGKTAAFCTSGARLFAVGSLLKFAKAGDVVWGSGFISEQDKCARGVIVNAVRGPLTRDILLKQGIDCPPVYGDPGLLLPALFKSPVKACYRIGILPHYVDMDRVRTAVKDSKIRIIDIRSGIDSVVQQARKCEILVSSSLHGCILGDAYGIPTVWVEVSDGVVGAGFKFRDYYASTDRDPVYVDWRQGIHVDRAVTCALNSPQAKIDLAPLIESFPLLSSSAEKYIGVQLWPRRPLQKLAETCLEVTHPNTHTHLKIPPATKAKVSTRTQSSTQSMSLKKTKPGPQYEPNKKLAIFGAVTENYTEYMIASLRSFMKHKHSYECDYFILGNSFSARTQRLITQHGIRYININLHKDFKRSGRHRYPGECFWIFKGPEVFYKMGYPYSLSVDGDTLCNKPLALDWLTAVKHIAGIDRGCTVGEFLNNIGQLTQLKTKLALPELLTDRRATNTGVLFYNNIELVKLNLYGHMVDSYKRSERAGIVRGGDDSSLALLFAIHEDVSLHVLERSWNVYQGLFKSVPNTSLNVNSNKDKKYFSSDDLNCDTNSDAFIIHLSSIKPWLYHRMVSNSEVQSFIEQWRALWPNTRNHRRISAMNRHNMNHKNTNLKSKAQKNTPHTTVSRLTHKRPCYKKEEPSCGIYWYRGAQPNMGDEITPYLISKLLNYPINTVQKRKIIDPLRHKGPVLISIGSVMRLCGHNAVIWGSGIRNIDQPINAAMKFCAVRGPLTRKRLLHLGYDCPEVYGDPALLLPRYYHPTVSKKYKLGIIPHLVDFEFISRLYAGRSDVCVIDTKTCDIEHTVEKILQCKCTVSSSLHGIILSIAYGLPTRWLKCSNKIVGDDSKYYDFFASLEPQIEYAMDYATVTLPLVDESLVQYSPLHMGVAGIPVKTLVASTHCYSDIYNTSLDLNKLLNVFPFDKFPQLEQTA